MKNRLFLVFTVFILTASSLLATINFDYVEANSKLKEGINSIQEDRSSTKEELDLKEKEIKAIAAELKKVEDEVRFIDNEIADTNEKIRGKDSEIKDSNDRIDELVEELIIVEERIVERDDLLKSRVRSMYKNGGSVNYLEVILGAQDFGDLINRITALSTIAQQDRNILEAHFNDKKLVEEVKMEMEQELIALEEQLDELEVLRAIFESQSKEKERIMEKLERQEGELHTDFRNLEETDSLLQAQERAMEAELKAWQKEQRELEAERKRQVEADRKRQEEADRKREADAELQRQREATQKSTQQSAPKPEPKEETQSAPVHTAPVITARGNFMRPTTGAISSPYGARWGSTHHGIDIGKGGRSGDVPIVAAEAGTVISSYYSSSYGNTVLISHNVGGQVITTLYAHMENRLVTTGQRVSKGQRLGFMGNTGRSFGAHLHFEVHEGPWNGAKSNSVDPLHYIPRN
ncbi:peptidoglycan DD-metalloendopeptidase family protein [Bacillaceae bacterium IKA-2]|jgi:peptidoglycan hydrolase CwlO-like protein|nr:peptidoglycan DD-metalloendopeptidase family protein [Bacillaceae bacterium IKA-2]